MSSSDFSSSSETENVSLRPVLFISLMALLLTETHGTMNRTFVWLLPPLLTLLIFRFQWSSASKRTLEALSAGAIVIFLLTMIAGLAGYLDPQLLLYPEQKNLMPLASWLLGGALLSSVSLYFICFRRPATGLAKVIFITTCLLVIAAYALVPMISQHPYIDTWILHEQGTSFFIHGQNPYTGVYTNIYSPGAEQTALTPFGMNFEYLPGVLFWMAPWKLLGLDTRFAMLTAHIICTVLVFVLQKRAAGFSRYALSLLYLSFPVFPFLLEQSWNDELTVMWFMLAVWSLANHRKVLFYVVINVLLLTKQFNFISAPFLIYLGLNEFKPQSRWKFVITCGLGAAFIYSCYLIADWRSFLGSLYGLHALKYPSIHAVFPERRDSLSLMTWAFITLGWKSGIAWGAIVVTLVGLLGFRLRHTSTVRVPDERAMVVGALGIIYLVFFLFSPASFGNYYWFTLGIVFAGFALEDDRMVFGITRPFMDSTMALFLVSRSLMVLAYRPFMPDTIYYHQVAVKIAQGLRPYVDFPFEYPPLAAPFIYLPQAISTWLSADDPLHYRTLFMLIAFVCDILLFALLRRREKRGILPKAATITYVVGGLILADLIYDRLDIAMTLLIVVSILLALRSKRISSLTAAAGGVFFKLTPIITLPFFIVQDSLQSATRWRTFARSTLISTVLLLVFFTASLLAFGSNFLDFLTPHLERGLQTESIWSSIAYFNSHYGFGTRELSLVQNYGSYNLKNPPDILLTLAKFTPAILLITFYLSWIAKTVRKPARELQFERAICIALFIFMLFGKVFSTQYLIWLVALFPLCGYRFDRPLGRILYALLWVSLGLTSWVFQHYIEFMHVEPLEWQFLILRNLLLITLLNLMIFEFFRFDNKKAYEAT